VSETRNRQERNNNRNVLAAARGSGLLAFGKFFNMGGRLIVALLLARLLGAAEYGLYNLAMSSATLAMAIGVFGFDDAMIRYVAIYAGRKDQARLWGALLLGIGGTFLASSLAGVGLYVLSDWLSIEIFHEPSLAHTMRLLSLVVPFLALSNVLVSIAHGFKKMEYSVLAEDIGQLIIRLVLLAVLSFTGLSATKAALVFGISDALTCFGLIYLLNKDFKWNQPIRSAHFEIREIITYALPLWLSGMISKFRNNIDTLVLGALSSAANVGVYSLIARVNLIGHISYQSIVRSVKPVLAEVTSRGARDEMANIYQTATRWTLILNLPMFLLLVLFPGNILAIFGKSYTEAGSTTALVILACAEFLNAGTGICGSIIDMGGYTRLKLFNAISQICILLGLEVLLVPRFGIIGAASAVLIAVCYVNFLRIGQVWFLFKILPYNKTFIKPVIAALAAAVAALGTAYLVQNRPGLVQLISETLVVFVVMGAVLLVMKLAPEDQMVAAKLYRWTSSLYTRQWGLFTRFITAKLP
jgi:O-antigen/teichoic acid export membrane protein